MKKLHHAVESMISSRKGRPVEVTQYSLTISLSPFLYVELCATTGNFVKSVATLGKINHTPIIIMCDHALLLGNVEENDTVSRALSRLSEVQEKVESLHSEQVRTT